MCFKGDIGKFIYVIVGINMLLYILFYILKKQN